MSLPHTRAVLNAALSGRLSSAEFTAHPVFQVKVPRSCPDVPASVLDARSQWANPDDYDRAARDLAGRFQKNFEKFSGVGEEIGRAGPKA